MRPIADATLLELGLKAIPWARSWPATSRPSDMQSSGPAKSRPGSSRETSAKAICAEILNFGPYVLRTRSQTGLGYGEWLHGEAVGCGMVMAADSVGPDSV